MPSEGNSELQLPCLCISTARQTIVFVSHIDWPSTPSVYESERVQFQKNKTKKQTQELNAVITHSFWLSKDAQSDMRGADRLLVRERMNVRECV